VTRTNPEPPAALRATAQRVEARLDALLADEAARWAAVDSELGAPLQCLRDLVLSGGKRLRPAFCEWTYLGAGGDDPTRAVDVGAGLELLHAFALIHDDVMDGAARRRGVTTAHRAFDDRHRVARWHGESRRFGEGVAILIGDLAFVYADMLVAALPDAARRIWDELRIELNVGQYLDMLGTARGDADLETAQRISTYKSGKYTVERPLHLGAALAGQLDRLEAPLSAYGLPLGEAFQLRDDLLGAFGDSHAIGKPVGDDLREGKPTPLLAIARERASTDEAEARAAVGSDLTADRLAAVQQALVSTGAATEVERRIEALTKQAVDAANALPLDASARDALADLATFVAWRDH
jgi:geranylgeranyl diphosphate synthase type I